ncbi:MAG: LysR family transcriptional regulator [Rhodocyclales bacterium GT-UBC]|nr:MAG: LysR family transcriptional regulator [Rhodocyclales bacterium GT-UBC]
MERISFELAEIQGFVAVAEKLNFKAAADAVFISQPALSRRIDKLEMQVGARLLERTTRHVALTEAGQRFLEHARAALEELQLGLQDISESTTRRRSVVTLACVPSVAANLLPHVLKRFAERFPDTRIRLIDEGAQEVLNSVLSGTADFGINFIGTQEPDIEFKAIHSEEYRLAVRDDHPLAQRETVSWESIADERLISVAKNSGNRSLMDNALARLNRRPVVFHEANHVAGALGLVEAGLGIAAIPGLALPATAHPRIRSIRLCEPTISRTLGLISKKGLRLQSAASALYAEFLNS